MIRFRWGGGEYLGELVEELPKGYLKVRCLEHGPRFTLGSLVILQPNQVIARDVVDQPKNKQAELETAMAEERKTLTPVAEILRPIQESAKAVRKAEADKAAGE